MTKILIVDDRPVNRQFLTTLLRYRKYETLEAADGVEALARIESWKPDLAIVDIVMPTMSGDELVRRLRQHADPDRARLPVVFYTATYREVAAREMADRCGVQYLLMKPAAPDVILATIEQAIGLSQPESWPHDGAVEQLHKSRERLAAIIEFTLDLSEERERERVLDKLVRAARYIVGAQAVFACVFDEARQIRRAVTGSVSEFAGDITSEEWTNAIEAMLTRYDSHPTCTLDSLPSSARAVSSHLAIPMIFHGRRRGALILLNSTTASAFSVEDGALAMTLSLHASITYDNVALYEEVATSQRRLRRLFDSDLIGIVEWGMNGITLGANDAYLRTIGSTRDDLEAGRINWNALTPPEWQSADEEALAQIAQRGECTPFEKELIRKDGHRVPVLIGAASYQEASDTGVCFVVDLTEQKRIASALLRSEEQLRSIIDNIPDVTWTVDSEGRSRFISSNIVSVLGYSQAELYDSDPGIWPGRIHPEDRSRVATAFHALFQSDEPFDVEYRIQHRDGTWRWVHDRARGTYVRDGVAQADRIFSDITAWKEAELERERLALDRELLLQSAAEGIFSVDSKGRCVLVNEAAARFLGYETRELTGQSVHELIHSHHADGTDYLEEDCPTRKAYRNGATFRGVDETFWRKDGTAVSVQYDAAPIRTNGTVQGAVVTFRDMTERLLLERQLEQANRVQSLGRVAAVIAHEFNNVLMGILPFSEVVERLAGDNARLIMAAEHIQKAVKRGKRIAGEILRFARPADPTLVPVDAADIIPAIVRELRSSISPSCQMETRLPPSPLYLLIDPQQLEQVLANLVLNACDAMNGGGKIRISVNRAIPSELPPELGTALDGFAHLTFEDNGSGIPATVIDHVFEPLFTTKKSGTGLGLAVVHQIIAKHQGQICVRSTPGAGTTFHILLKTAEQFAGGSVPSYV